MSYSIEHISIVNGKDGGVVSTSTTGAYYDTFDDLRLHVAETLNIDFIGYIWKDSVIEARGINRIVVAFDETVHTFTMV
jgi:hydrogenase maturation factor HypE